MKAFQLSISGLIIRFYVMMAIIIVSVFTGIPALSILALPVFLSAMLGFKFDFSNIRKMSMRSTNINAKSGKKIEMATT